MTPELLKEARVKFLDETTAHFNSTNRGVTNPIVGCGCSYVEGCAIGRHLPKELAEACDNDENGCVDADGVFSILPTWLQDLGKLFLADVQKLHDNKHNWVESGLSEQGKSELGDIRKKHELI